MLTPSSGNTQKLNLDLYYNSVFSGLSGKLQYNGNISAMVWNSTGKTKQGYGFTYDGLNRLTLGDHKTYISLWIDNPYYEEKSLAYDPNGNIKRLVRTNSTGGNSADYTYTYKGNQLDKVNAGTAYVYDKNGNTTTDGLRGFSLAYNILNLPKSITKGTDNIAYIYTATGEKLAKRMKDNTNQYYAGNMVYNSSKALDYILFDEGKVNKSGSLFVYEYHLKDHLGNTRVAFQPNGSATTTLQVAEYYPFGSNYTPLSPDNSNKYLYNGKEKQSDVLSSTSLDWYDYGARFYDPQIGRWHVVDPAAEERQWLSPYNYCSLNPINRIDPNGMLDDWVERDNQVVWDENVTSANDADLKSGDKYLGKEGYGVNTETGASIHYKSDGTTSEGSFGIGEATVTGTMSEHARTMSNPVVQAIHQGQEDFLNHPVTKATVNTLLFVATGGIEGVTALGGAAVRSIGNIKVPIYRVFGGEARAIGNYWSPINPRLYGSQYRNLAGLPNSNTGAFTLKATTPLRNINPSTIKPAAPFDGNFGRLVPELKVFDKGSVVVKDFWVNF